MEIMLLKDVEKLGQKGEIIRVRDGFGRNFLIPRKLALPTTAASERFLEEQRVRSGKRKEKEKTEALAKGERLAKLKIVLEARAGEQDKLFGSVTAEDIHQALARQGVEVDKKRIHLKESIRALGTYAVTVELYPEVKVTVAVDVIRKP